MSSTSTVRKAAKQEIEIAEPGMRADGAVCCTGKMPRGRCKKLLVTPEANLVCPNGHQIPLEEVRDSLLSDSSHAPQEHEILNLMTVRDPETWRKLLRRLVAPDFMVAEVNSWQWLFLNRSPERFIYILHRADYYDRKVAVMLRDYWERNFCKNNPLIGRWLDAQTTQGERTMCREQALQAYSSWDSPFPEGLLLKYQLFATAAKYLGEPVARAYENNVKQLGDTLAEPGRVAFYFRHENMFSTSRSLIYNILLDPEWTREIFTRNNLHYCGTDSQLNIAFRPQQHELKWNFQGTHYPIFSKWFLGRLDIQKPSNGLNFKHDTSDHIWWTIPTEASRLQVADDYDYAEQVISQLISYLGFCQDLPSHF